MFATTTSLPLEASTLSWLVKMSELLASVMAISISDEPSLSGVAPGANKPCVMSSSTPPPTLSPSRKIWILSVLLTEATSNWPGTGQKFVPAFPSAMRIWSPTRTSRNFSAPLWSLTTSVLVAGL